MKNSASIAFGDTFLVWKLLKGSPKHILAIGQIHFQVTGGSNPMNSDDEIYEFVPGSEEWRLRSERMDMARFSHVAIPLPDEISQRCGVNVNKG